MKLTRPAVLVLAYLALALAVLAPIIAVQVPSLGDYLNHLARIHIEMTVRDSALLRRYYEPTLQWVPYLGMDVPVRLMAPLFGIYGAGRMFVALCVIMPVLAASALHYAVHRRASFVPLLAFAFCYNYPLSRGFLVYLFSACLAIMLFAAWIASQSWPRWRRAALFVPAALALFMCHAFAFGAYGILLGAYELARAARAGRGRAALLDVAAAASQAALPAYLALWGGLAGTFGATHTTHYGSLPEKLAAALSPLYFPGGTFITVLPVLGAVLAVALLLRWLASGQAVLAPALLPPLAAVTAAAVAAPHVLANIWGADFRLPLVAAIVLIGALSPGCGLPRRGVGMVLAAIFALAVARSADATMMLRALDRQVTALRGLVAALPRGARLLVVDGPADAPLRAAPIDMTGHIAFVATIDRDAFVPFLFWGNTPIRVQPAMRDSASLDTMALTLPQLRDGMAAPAPGAAVPAFGYGGSVYWLGWPEKFDYVLITHFGAPVGVLPAGLTLVGGNSIAELLKIAVR